MAQLQKPIATTRLQNELSQDVLLWRADYFKLKINKAQETQEEILTFCLTA